jgi:hypothetical protein
VLALAPTPALTAQQPPERPVPRRSARDMHARIETDREAYRAGDTVAIWIAVTNASDAPLEFVHWAPWHIVRFVATDERGRPVAPAHPVYGKDAISTHIATFASGKTVVGT